MLELILQREEIMLINIINIVYIFSEKQAAKT